METSDDYFRKKLEEKNEFEDNYLAKYKMRKAV